METWAKILYSSQGTELIRWFSAPELAHAHLDYPLIVPTLHAFTYGVIGHVNEFITKFWPFWMFLMLGGAFLSLCRWPCHNRGVAVSCLTCMAFLPATLMYVRWEGATLPLFFFAGLGFMECARAIQEEHHDRLILGLLMLLCSALVKFEGMLLLFSWGGLLFLSGSAGRRLLFGWKGNTWIVAAFGVLLFLPYLWFRLHVPVLHPESHWIREALHNPLYVLMHGPIVLVQFICRRFVRDHWISWTLHPENGIEWSGQWSGWISLFDEKTAGLAWLLVLVIIVTFCFRPSARKPLLAIIGVMVLFAGLISVVFSSLPRSIDDIQCALQLTESMTSGRYFYPVLMAAWLATAVVWGFSDSPSQFNDTIGEIEVDHKCS